MCAFFSNTLHQLFFFVVFRPRRTYVISSVVFNLYFLLRFICFEKNFNEERYIYIRPSIDFFFLFSFTMLVLFIQRRVCVFFFFSNYYYNNSTVYCNGLLYPLCFLNLLAFLSVPLDIKRTHALEVKFEHTCENELSWYERKK